MGDVTTGMTQCFAVIVLRMRLLAPWAGYSGLRRSPWASDNRVTTWRVDGQFRRCPRDAS